MPLTFNWQQMIESFDERRDIIIPGDTKETVNFCVKQFLQIAADAIEKRGRFVVALSGGSTPNAIFKELTNEDNRSKIDWTKVFCFWGDERSVPPSHPDSNYHTAMQAGLSALPLPAANIFRMPAESDIEENTLAYEQQLLSICPSGEFDLVMLGMGEDAHTASLFPRTHALHSDQRLVVANYVPQKKAWRMTLTYKCINAARQIDIYVMGKNKAAMLSQVLSSPYDPDSLPIQRIGTSTHKALWILDRDAGEKILI